MNTPASPPSSPTALHDEWELVNDEAEIVAPVTTTHKAKSEGSEQEEEAIKHEVPEGYLPIRLRQGEEIRPAWFKATQQVDKFVSKVLWLFNPSSVSVLLMEMTLFIIAVLCRRARQWEENQADLYGHVTTTQSLDGRVWYRRKRRDPQRHYGCTPSSPPTSSAPDEFQGFEPTELSVASHRYFPVWPVDDLLLLSTVLFVEICSPIDALQCDAHFSSRVQYHILKPCSHSVRYQ